MQDGDRQQHRQRGPEQGHEHDLRHGSRLDLARAHEAEARRPVGCTAPTRCATLQRFDDPPAPQPGASPSPPPSGGITAGRRDSRETRTRSSKSLEKEVGHERGTRRKPVDDANRVHIFDTTLRDGEQSPGISLNTQEKVEIAQQLARLGVDVIEAGFPITSPGDFEAVEAISRKVEGPMICGLARTHKADIDAAWNAIKDSQRPRIHTFISTSDIHIEHQLQTTREDVKGQAKAAVALARSYTDDVEFSPMDATRADVEFTAEVCAIAVAEGATVINIPDTVGYTTPGGVHGATSARLYELVPGLDDVERLGPLPRRPGPGRLQLLRRAAGRRPPGRVRRQRHRRARRQLLAGGDRDAAADPPRRARPRHRRSTRASWRGPAAWSRA